MITNKNCKYYRDTIGKGDFEKPAMPWCYAAEKTNCKNCHFYKGIHESEEESRKRMRREYSDRQVIHNQI